MQFNVSQSENFSDSSLHHIFKSENFRFPFATKNSLTWREIWKNKLKKIVGRLLDKLRKLSHEWNGYLEIFSRPQVVENCRPNLFLRKDIRRKQSLGAPE